MEDTKATPSAIDAENALFDLRGVRCIMSTLAQGNADISSDVDHDCMFALLASVTRQSVETLTDALGMR